MAEVLEQGPADAPGRVAREGRFGLAFERRDEERAQAVEAAAQKIVFRPVVCLEGGAPNASFSENALDGDPVLVLPADELDQRIGQRRARALHAPIDRHATLPVQAPAAGASSPYTA